MIRVDIETIIMASGPVPSLIVLRERAAGAGSGAPQRSLSIQTGSFEAAAISRGIDHGQGNRVDAPVFYARVVLAEPASDGTTSETIVDARPSDALALAVRANAPIYVEDDVMNRAGTLSLRTERESTEDELEQFDQFVQTLSPDDF